LLVTADGVFRGLKYIGLKEICDHALELCTEQGHKVRAVIVQPHATTLSSWTKSKDVAARADNYDSKVRNGRFSFFQAGLYVYFKIVNIIKLV
jgi:acyl-coenzyme A synthetase/AMP-(fatty) acid ligase